MACSANGDTKNQSEFGAAQGEHADAPQGWTGLHVQVSHTPHPGQTTPAQIRYLLKAEPSLMATKRRDGKRLGKGFP